MGVTVGLGCKVEGCETLTVWEAMGTGIKGGGGGPRSAKRIVVV